MDSAPAVEPVVKYITQESINRYADATGDYNPIHVDEAYARATPFGGTIAHGMLVLAQDWRASGRLKVRFKGPARPGDTVTAQATPRAARAGGQGGVLEYAVECRNQRGETLISGTAEVRVPSGESAGRE